MLTTQQGAIDDLDAALAEARERGVSRAAQILAGRDMLLASAFTKLIGISRQAVRNQASTARSPWPQRKRGLHFPKWQVTSDGGLLPQLPKLFDLLGQDS